MGKKTGFEDINSSFAHRSSEVKPSVKINANSLMMMQKRNLLKVPKLLIKYSNKTFKRKIEWNKTLLANDVYNQFNESLRDRKSKQLSSETTFIGINSAELIEHQQNNMLEVKWICKAK